MIRLFDYDNNKMKVVMNSPDILLIKEFKELWTNERNVCKEDKSGEKRLKVFRELTYIYLAIDWRSPYKEWSERERHELALKDAQLTQEEFDDPLFREACRKYKALQETSKIGWFKFYLRS